MLFFILACFALVGAFSYVLYRGMQNPLELDAEPIEPDKEEYKNFSEEELLIIHFKTAVFDELYTWGYFKEGDGTEQLEARDKKSKLVIAYMREDLSAKIVKQPQQQGGNNGK